LDIAAGPPDSPIIAHQVFSDEIFWLNCLQFLALSFYITKDMFLGLFVGCRFKMAYSKFKLNFRRMNKLIQNNFKSVK
jgi:hypothetical protein